MNKEKKLLEYINKCDEILMSRNQPEIKNLRKEIIGVYGNEIPNIKSQLNAYGVVPKDLTIEEEKHDIQLLKAKLENYKDNLEMELEKYHNENNNGTNININNSSTATNNVNINISLEQVIKEIYDLPNNILSDDEKSELEDKINSLKVAAETQNKDKIKNKLNNLVNYALEKGPAAIALTSSVITLFNDYIKPLFFK